jgi:hypothetical protein
VLAELIVEARNMYGNLVEESKGKIPAGGGAIVKSEFSIDRIS